MSPGRRILLRDIRTYVSETGGVKFLSVAVAVTFLGVIWLLWVGGKSAAFLAGAFTVLLPSVIIYLVVVYGEFAPRLAGVAAEKEMYKLLRKHVGAEVWHVVPHVRFKNAADVDMVVVTPRAVLAMEVKWHGKFRSEDKVRSSANQALYRTRRLEEMLRKLGLSPQVPVLPVLGVWGPASDLVAEGVRKFDGVTVVDAHQPDKWLPLLGTGHVSADTAASVVALLAQHQASLRL
jgi:hypothetical protein